MFLKRKVKFITLISLLTAGLVTSHGQVTLFPNVEESATPDLYIRKVEVTEVYTKIHFYYHPRGEAFVCADKAFHIAPSGTRDARYMVTAKNIPICPEREKVTMYQEDLEFEIWFPYLEKNIYKIDVVESPRDGFNFYGVTINNGQQKAIPPESQFTSRDAFENYFEEHSVQLNVIEGIWKIHETMDHYGYDQVVDKKYKEDDYELAVIKEGERYLVYELDGTPIEAEYMDVAGGRGKYFKKYFRDINETITAYAVDLTPERFELNYQLPRRLAMEALLVDYFPGDRIFVTLECIKEFPNISENSEDNKKE